MKNKCHNCGSEKFSAKKVDEVFNIDGKVYLVKNITALVCDVCGESYFTPKAQRETMKIIGDKSRLVDKIETEVYECV